jgi:hypothetical protein
VDSVKASEERTARLNKPKLTFDEWMTYDDGNEAGMTVYDAAGDPAIWDWMRIAWNAGQENK